MQRFSLLLVPLTCFLLSACPGAPIDEPELEDCSDAVDNDLDGLTDCADVECWGVESCRGVDEVCDNGADDNLNGLVDCRDAACADAPGCVGGPGVLVPGEGLLLQDVSDSGGRLCYLDSAGALWEIALGNDAPRLVANNVDKARYKNDRLTVFRGVDITGDLAGGMLVEQDDGSVTAWGNDVIVRSVRVSDDGRHVYHEEKPEPGSGLEDLYLDGRLLIEGAKKERARFTDNNEWLILATDVEDQNGDVISRVQAWPLGGAAPRTLVTDGAANRFVVTPDSADLILAINEDGDVADLVRMPIDGGMDRTLVLRGSDNGFSVLDDGSGLVFLSPDDPDAPTDFALEVIGLDGAGRSVLVAGGVRDVASESADGIVWAGEDDPVHGRPSLAYVGADGSGAVALTDSGRDIGFTPEGDHYCFYDRTVEEASGRRLGRFRVLDVGSGQISTVADDVDRATRLGAGRVAFVDAAGVLSWTALDGGTIEPLFNGVDDYDAVPDGPGSAIHSRVAFSVESGPEAGLYLAALP